MVAPLPVMIWGSTMLTPLGTVMISPIKNARIA